MTLDQADFLDQLATQVASVVDRLDAMQMAQLEAALLPQSTVPRSGSIGTPTTALGQGDVQPSSVLANGAVTSAAIADGAVTSTKIVAGAVAMTKFAQSIIPPRVVTVLPTLPADDWPTGCYVFLTTDTTLYKNVAGTWTVASETELVANTIYAGSIAAGAIGARELAATIVLASLIKTANTGARVEIDQNGIRCIASDNTLLVNIPTNGDDVYVAAEIQALALTVTGNASLRGTGNELAAGSVTALQVGITNPAVKPTLTQAVQTLSATTMLKGLAYDSAGGAGGATAVWWSISSSPNDPTLYELLASDGSTNRSKNLTTEFNTGINTGTGGGVCVLGNYVYVLWKKAGAATWRVSRYLKSTLAVDASYDAVSFPIATPRYPSIGSDGTNIFIADIAATTGYISWNKYDSVMAKVGSTVATGSAPGGASMTGGDIYVGNGDFGAWRLLIQGWSGGGPFAFDSTGTRQSSNDFTRDGGDPDGIGYDGTYFYTLKAGYGNLNKYSAITTAGTYYVGYTWYDSAGTTHETAISPRQSISLTERRFLSVTTPALPGAGGADDPDNRRIYVKQSATDPGSTGLKLQTTSTTATTTLASYNAAGAADPASNNFPGGTAAELKSASGEWSLKGDGTAAFTALTATVGAAATDAIMSKVTGDTYPRFTIDGDGGLSWGPGNTAADTNLYREINGRLASNDDIRSYGVLITITTAGAPSDATYVGGTAPNGGLVVDTTNSRLYTRVTTWKYAALTSDARLKDVLGPVTGALGRLRRLKPVRFRWKVPTAHGWGIRPNDAERVGLVAQEVLDAEPLWVDINGVGEGEQELVGGDNGYALDAQGQDIALLIAAVQELAAEVDELRARLDSLRDG